MIREPDMARMECRTKKAAKKNGEQHIARNDVVSESRKKEKKRESAYESRLGDQRADAECTSDKTYLGDKIHIRDIG